MKVALLGLSVITSLLVACSSTPPAAPISTATPQASSAAPAPSASTAKAAPVIAQELPAHLDKASLIYQQRSVYFDYDVFSIRNNAVPVIERQAKYLSAHPELHIMLEGNADERGGREYNLALGQKRSEAVKSALSTFGVKNAQVEAISLGSEKPRMTGHDEKSWAENRRVDFVYPSKM